MGNKIEKVVFDFLYPLIEKLGYELADVEYRTVNDEKNLTVIICGEETITLNDCEKVHLAIDAPLDELNPTSDQSYTLNVSSFGLDRAFKTKRDFERNIGNAVEVKLYTPMNGKKIYIGELCGIDDEFIEIQMENKKIKLNIKGIAKVSQHIVF